MGVYKRGDVWWYKFNWDGRTIRESTKQGNKRVAEQIESARRTQLAKGEVGLRDRKPVPTLAEFVDDAFRPYVKSRFANKPSTLAYYDIQLRHLVGHAPLAKAKLDAITPDLLTGFIEKQRGEDYEVSSINRSLQVLRRLTRLAAEWEVMEKAPPRISLLPGERRRERVLSASEEQAYLKATVKVAEQIEDAYQRALSGIRATQRGKEPIKPEDPFLLRDVATVLLDCALRPEECYRLRWEEVRDGAVHIQHGKTANARRSVPVSARTGALLDMRKPCRLHLGSFLPQPRAAISSNRRSRGNMPRRARLLNSAAFRSTRSGIHA